MRYPPCKMDLGRRIPADPGSPGISGKLARVPVGIPQILGSPDPQGSRRSQKFRDFWQRGRVPDLCQYSASTGTGPVPVLGTGPVAGTLALVPHGD